jgi:hypothetical protein
MAAGRDFLAFTTATGLSRPSGAPARYEEPNVYETRNHQADRFFRPTSRAPRAGLLEPACKILAAHQGAASYQDRGFVYFGTAEDTALLNRADAAARQRGAF